MKKISLIACGAMVALAANAQYTVNPETSVVAAQGPKTVEYLVLPDASVTLLENAGAKMTYIGADGAGRNLWYWSGFAPGDDSYPGPDMEEAGYVSIVVAPTEGWSGAGFNIRANNDASNPADWEEYQGADLSMFNENTRFHLAYYSPSDNAPASIALILLDGDSTSPAKVAVGTSFDDAGAIYPTVGPKANDDWQGIDISFADLKRLYPSFNYDGDLSNWYGNIFSFLGGAVEGTTFAFDCVYFYNTGSTSDEPGEEPGEGAVEGVASDALGFIITANTINVNGGLNGIALYNLNGQLVKSTEGCVLGINGLQKGIYVAKSGNKAAKVVVR